MIDATSCDKVDQVEQQVKGTLNSPIAPRTVAELVVVWPFSGRVHASSVFTPGCTFKGKGSNSVQWIFSVKGGGYPLAQLDNLCYCSLCVCVSRHWQNSKVESGQNLQSKHLKGRLGPRVGDGHFFGSMEVSWDPALVT